MQQLLMLLLVCAANVSLTCIRTYSWVILHIPSRTSEFSIYESIARKRTQRMCSRLQQYYLIFTSRERSPDALYDFSEARLRARTPNRMSDLTKNFPPPLNLDKQVKMAKKAQQRKLERKRGKSVGHFLAHLGLGQTKARYITWAFHCEYGLQA